MYVRDVLAGKVGCGLTYKQYKAMDVAQVISTHRSKSAVLPVYLLQRPDLGLRLILRNNFYNWKISVISEKPIVEPAFEGLFHTIPPIEPDYTGDPLHPVYFEGFPEDLIFGYYSTSDQKKWSAEINGGNEAIWMVIHLIMRGLGAVKSLTWHTRESHAKQLKEERDNG